MINVWCVWVEQKYSFNYVKNLYNSLRKRSTKPFTFYCLIDSVEKKIEYGDIRYIIKPPTNHFKFWNKVYLFEKYSEYLDNDNNNVFFDLDVVILDDIDDLLDWAIEYDDNKMAVCHAYERGEIELYVDMKKRSHCTPYNSSICIWTNDYKCTFMTDDALMNYYEGIDILLWMKDVPVNTIPRFFYYAIAFVNGKLLTAFTVATLNQLHEKNEELLETFPWIKEYWCT